MLDHTLSAKRMKGVWQLSSNPFLARPSSKLIFIIFIHLDHNNNYVGH